MGNATLGISIHLHQICFPNHPKYIEMYIPCVQLGEVMMGGGTMYEEQQVWDFKCQQNIHSFVQHILINSCC